MHPLFIDDVVRFLLRRWAAVLVVAAIPGAAFFVSVIVSPPLADDLFPVVRASDPARPGAGFGRLPMPAVVKGLYVTSDAAGHRTMLPRLVSLVDRTELNALVIDVKNSRGELAFVSDAKELAPFIEKRPALGRLSEFTAPLKEKKIYLIARVFVFQDSAYAAKMPQFAVERSGGGLWRDHKGIPWLDPAAKEVWKYNAAVAREAYEGGFDEVQFDYIRFPSDGTLSTIIYPVYDGKKTRSQVMEEFFGYLDAELRRKRGIPISVDLFGLTMWNHEGDLNIGQRLDIAAPHFDAISPMVYPSHYPAGFNGYGNPAAFPYEVIRDNMAKAKPLLARLAEESEDVRPIATIRPWLQDFDLGSQYDAAQVRAQIRAAMEGGASGWLIWNARNVYTEGAFESD